MRSGSSWRLAVSAFVAVVVTALAFTFRHELGPALHELEKVVDDSGPWGPLVFGLGYIVWAVLCLPGPLILALAGTLFASHFWLAILTVSLGDATAQGIAFLVARRVARDRVRAMVGHHAWFQWLEEQTRQGGIWRVLTIRALPFFPNSLANYAFGLTAVDFGPYLLGSWAGSLPNIAICIGGTAGVVHLLKNHTWEHDLWLALGLVLTACAAMWLVGRMAGSRMGEVPAD